MPCLRLGIVGGHDVTVEMEQADADAALALITAGWAMAEPVGHLDLSPTPGTVLRVSLRDVVLAEITE